MAVDSSDEQRNAWLGRPRTAFALRVAAWILPIALSFLATKLVSDLLPPPESGAHAAVWAMGLTLVATAVLYTADKAARRLLPLAALLKLSLVFPDRAPSRFRAALRTGTVRQLEQRVDEIKQHGLPEDPVLAAETLIDLIAALSAHDRLTRGHAERVRAYTRMIGEELHLEPDDLEKLQWAGLLHDVGKLFVPGEILNKRGALDDEEFEIIKLHPGWGAELCAPLRGWLGDWVEAVGQHHEHWNGGGYPEGRSGEDIALAARIVAVADVFDVITSVRSYKRSFSAVAGREELTRCAGTQFDARIVRAFLSLSLDRLRLAMGPLSSVAHLPGARSLPLGPAAGAVASGVVAAGALLLGGIFDTGDATPARERSELVAAPAGQPTPPEEPDPVAPEPSDPPRSAPVITPPPILWPQARPVAGPIPVAAERPELVARDDVVSTPEDQGVTIDLLANDIHPGLGATTAAVSTPPSHGVASAGAGSTMDYTPATSWNGSDSFTYTIDDGTGRTASATVTITVTPAPDPPTANDDAATTPEDTTVVIDALTNDADPDGDTLTITTVSSTDGTATTDGATVTYTPAPDSHGTHTVTYTIDDGTGRTASATVTITVTPVADPPVATDDAYVTQTDTVLVRAAPGVLGNDSDEDGDTLTASLAAGPAFGVLALAGDGSFTYTPNGGFTGSDTFTYAVDDGNGGVDSATVTVTVTSTSIESGWYLGTGTSGWSLTSTPPAAAEPEPDHDGDGAVGLTIESSDQKLTTTDPLKYQHWTLTPTTPLVLAGPVRLELWSTAEDFDDHDVDYSVWLQDCATDGTDCTTLASAVDVHVDDWNGGAGTWAYREITVGAVDHTIPVGRMVQLRLMFGHDDVWVALSGARPSRLVVTQPTEPVAVDDVATTPTGTPVIVSVLDNDSDPNGDPLTVVSASSTDGTVSTDGTTVTYTPAPGPPGTQTFTYTIEDGTGRSATAIVTVTVT